MAAAIRRDFPSLRALSLIIYSYQHILKTSRPFCLSESLPFSFSSFRTAALIELRFSAELACGMVGSWLAATCAIGTEL